MEELELQQQSYRAQWLLDEANEQGYLTFDQILEIFPEAEDDLNQLEDLFTYLARHDVAVYETEADVPVEAEEVKEEEEEAEESEEEDSDSTDLSNISADNTISLYLAEMSQVPLLTREEELTLAKQLERGQEAQSELDQNGHNPQDRARLKQLIEEGEAAREHLIKANTRLVVSVAKKYRGQGVPFSDLIQAGNVGLIKAVDKYDYRRGTKFSTYATWWIRQSITRTLSDHGRTIRIPVHMSDRIRRLYRTAQKLEQASGRRPTPEEIAEEMGKDPEEVRWMLRVSQRPLSLEMPVGDEGDSEFGDFIEDQNLPMPAEKVQQNLLRENLQQMLSSLTPREARVLDLRFGLQDGRSHTLKQVGEKLGVTRERIRQIEGRALRKLRHPRYSRGLRSYLK